MKLEISKDHCLNICKDEQCDSDISVGLSNKSFLIDDLTDIKKLQEIVKYLYAILDDIDTAGDIAKLNDSLYRKIVENVQQKKNYYLYSDGYKLFYETELSSKERPLTFYEIVKATFDGDDK